MDLLSYQRIFFDCAVHYVRGVFQEGGPDGTLRRYPMDHVPLVPRN